MPEILERGTALFEQLIDEPICGVTGGYHFPAAGARTKILGIGVRKYVLSFPQLRDTLTREARTDLVPLSNPICLKVLEELEARK